jgi:hypothetical protein
MPRFGTKLQVWEGTARMTSGLLRRADLMVNNRGKVVSIRAHANAVNRYADRKNSLIELARRAKAREARTRATRVRTVEFRENSDNVHSIDRYIVPPRVVQTRTPEQTLAELRRETTPRTVASRQYQRVGTNSYRLS